MTRIRRIFADLIRVIRVLYLIRLNRYKNLGQLDLVWLRAGDGLAVLQSSRQWSARPRHV